MIEPVLQPPKTRLFSGAYLARSVDNITLHVAAVRPTKFYCVQLLLQINNPEELGAANIYRRNAHANTGFMAAEPERM